METQTVSTPAESHLANSESNLVKPRTAFLLFLLLIVSSAAAVLHD